MKKLLIALVLLMVLALAGLAQEAIYDPILGKLRMRDTGGGATRFVELADFAAPIAYTDGFVLRMNGTKAATARLALTDLTAWTATYLPHFSSVANPHSVTAAQAGAVALTGNESIAGIKDFLSYPTGPATAPTGATQFVTKAYADTIAAGLSVRDAVVCATAAAGTLASDFENGDTIDTSVTLATGNRILIKDQAAGEENGIYVVAASGAPTRATDFDIAGEMTRGAFTNVLGGTANGNTQWCHTTAGTITVGVTPLTFSQLSAPATTTASLGVQKVGNDFRLKYGANLGLTLSGNDAVVDYDNSTIGIVSNKLAVKDGGITNAKLATINTAGKVDGAAITGLASLPAGAGVIPIANLATGTPDGSRFVRDDGTLAVPSGSGGAGGSALAANNYISIIGINGISNITFSFSAAVNTTLAYTSAPYVAVDFTNTESFKMVIVSGSSQGTLTSAIADHYKAWIQYSADSGVNWANLDGSAAIATTSSISFDNFYSTGTWLSRTPKVGAAWSTIPAAARTAVWLRVANCWETGGTASKYSSILTVGLQTQSVGGRWLSVPTSSYTATPASTSTITMSSTAGLAVGLPIKYAIGGTTSYGVITTVTTNTSIAVAGAPLGGSITALSYGRPEGAVQVDFFVSGTYGNGAADLLATDVKTYFKWKLGKAYLVRIEVTQNGVDTGAEPKINAKVATAAVSTNDTNKGLQLTTAGAWVSTGIDINTTNYITNPGSAIEVSCTEAGGTGDATSLTASYTFVLE